MLKQNIRIDMVEKMFRHTSSDELARDALIVLLPKRKEIKKYLSVVILCFLPAIYISISKETVVTFF